MLMSLLGRFNTEAQAYARAQGIRVVQSESFGACAVGTAGTVLGLGTTWTFYKVACLFHPYSRFKQWRQKKQYTHELRSELADFLDQFPAGDQVEKSDLELSLPTPKKAAEVPLHAKLQLATFSTLHGGYIVKNEITYCVAKKLHQFNEKTGESTVGWTYTPMCGLRRSMEGFKADLGFQSTHMTHT